MKRQSILSGFAMTMLLTLLSMNSNAQITLTLQPGASGKDTHLDSRLSNTPGGNVEELNGIGWTVNGVPMAERGLIEFDLTAVPVNAVVQSAYLTLSYNPTSINGGGQVSLTGSNEGRLQRITAPWSEATATWNNQPPADTLNEVILRESDSLNQNYTLDVKTLVQGMISNPATNYGFLLRMVEETPYRSLTFASSDHPNAAIRPKLIVIYTVPSSVNSITSGSQYFSVSPNPATDLIKLKFTNTKAAKCLITIHDMTGKNLISEEVLLPSGEFTHMLNVGYFATGIYTLGIQQDGIITNRKITISH